MALIQSLVRKGEVSDLIAGYGHLVVDECHHLSASTFEMVACRSSAVRPRRLSATIARKDGHHQSFSCSVAPYDIASFPPDANPPRRSFDHVAQVRTTSFRLPPDLQVPGTSMPAIFAALAKDETAIH